MLVSMPFIFAEFSRAEKSHFHSYQRGCHCRNIIRADAKICRRERRLLSPCCAGARLALEITIVLRRLFQLSPASRETLRDAQRRLTGARRTVDRGPPSPAFFNAVFTAARTRLPAAISPVVIAIRFRATRPYFHFVIVHFTPSRYPFTLFPLCRRDVYISYQPRHQESSPLTNTVIHWPPWKSYRTRRADRGRGGTEQR